MHLQQNVVEQYTVLLLNALQPTLVGVPPIYYLGALIGIINGCVFYLRFGRGLKRFLPYLGLGAAGAIAGITVGEQMPETGLMLGDVNMAAASFGTWIILFIARSIRL